MSRNRGRRHHCLFSAIISGNADDVRVLCRRNRESVNMRSSEHVDCTPLTYLGAIEEDDGEKARALLEAGAEPNMLDGLGFAPLHFAVANGKISVAKALLEGGADANLKNTSGLTSLDILEANEETNKMAKEELRALLVSKGASRSSGK